MLQKISNMMIFLQRRGVAVTQIIRSWTMIISFVAFMSSQSAVADPKSFPAQQM